MENGEVYYRKQIPEGRLSIRPIVRQAGEQTVGWIGRHTIYIQVGDDTTGRHVLVHSCLWTVEVQMDGGKDESGHTDG